MLGLFGIDQIKVGTPKLKELGFITKLGLPRLARRGVYKNRSSSKQNINKNGLFYRFGVKVFSFVKILNLTKQLVDNDT